MVKVVASVVAGTVVGAIAAKVVKGKTSPCSLNSHKQSKHGTAPSGACHTNFTTVETMDPVQSWAS